MVYYLVIYGILLWEIEGIDLQYDTNGSMNVQEWDGDMHKKSRPEHSARGVNI